MLQEELYSEWAVEILRELVSLDSQNPPGREEACARYLAGLLKQEGFDTYVQEFSPGRCNLLAVLGRHGQNGLILNGHLDVVPAGGGWSVPPMSLTEHKGKLYGRGTCDMKGAISAMVAAAIRIAREKKPLKKNLVLLFVGDEETKNLGIRALLAERNIAADAALIGEPSEMRVLFGNKGYASYYVKTRGKACHASTPHLGENAIYHMAPVLVKLQQYARQVQKIKDPYMGGASFSVGTIQGGTKINIVPEHCEIEVERRVLPGETAKSVLKELQDALCAMAEVEPRSFMAAGFTSPQHPFIKKVSQETAEVVGEKETPDVFLAGTEASFFTNLGIPTAIIGPGSLKQAHRVDEFVEKEQLLQSVELYYRIASRMVE